MKKIALIYSFNTQKTTQVAKHIIELFDKGSVEELNAEEINGEKFISYDYLILGVPTWFDGELPNYWDEFLPDLKELNLKGKKIAIFGNGDQKEYPENFVDGIGIMAEILEKRGAKIIGHTSLEGYLYDHSRAIRDNKFLGLAIDFENQAKQMPVKVSEWVTLLKKEFDNGVI
jgi:flavodoxin I